MEGLAVALAGEDYSRYLTSKYADCEKIRLMNGGFQLHDGELSPIEGNGSLGSLVPRGGLAENYLRALSRAKIAESRLDRVLSSDVGVGTCLDEIRQLEFEARESRQELQQQLSGFWFPLFTGLSQLSTGLSSRSIVEESALDILFSLLIELAHKHFNPDMWHMTIKGVLFPLFDDLNLSIQHSPIQPPPHFDLRPVPKPPPEFPSEDTNSSPTSVSPESQVRSSPPKRLRRFASGEEWIGARCWAALKHLVDLVDKQFDCIAPFLIDILNLIVSSKLYVSRIKQPSDHTLFVRVLVSRAGQKLWLAWVSRR